MFTAIFESFQSPTGIINILLNVKVTDLIASMNNNCATSQKGRGNALIWQFLNALRCDLSRHNVKISFPLLQM